MGVGESKRSQRGVKESNEESNGELKGSQRVKLGVEEESRSQMGSQRGVQEFSGETKRS